MSKSKVRITAIDVVLILAVLFVCVSAVIRNENVRRFNSQNSIKDSVITISVKGIERNNFSLFEKNNTVFATTNNGQLKIGEIKSIKSTPAVVITNANDSFAMEPDFSKLDITLDISARCLVDEHGFYSINGMYVTPSYSFTADNGRIKFDCEVVSVKTVD